jgi:hypothetical protein
MPSDEIIKAQKRIIEKLQQDLLKNLGNFTRICKQQNSADLNKVLDMVLKVKENKQKRYKTDDEELRALYLAFHRGTAPASVTKSASVSTRAVSRSSSLRTRSTRKTRSPRMRGGMKWIFIGLITILVFLTSTVDAAIGMSAKSLTQKQIKKAFSADKAYTMEMALANTGGSCLPVAELAASAASGEDTVKKWAESKNHTAIAAKLDDFGIEGVNKNMAAWVAASHAHGSDTRLYDVEPADTKTGFASWDEMTSITNAAADNIYRHWSTNVGGNTGDDICMYRFSIASTETYAGHAIVGIVRKGAGGKLYHGYIDSNRFAGLVENDVQWLYVEPGFFSMSERFELGNSVKVSDKPLFQVIDSFGNELLGRVDQDFSPSVFFQQWFHSNPLEHKYEPGVIEFDYENNAKVSANSPKLPGDVFPPLRYDISVYKNFLELKREATWLAREYAEFAVEHQTKSLDIDYTCKRGDRENCKPYKLKAKSI